MKYFKIFYNLTISIIFFLATHITEAYHIQVFSTLTSSRYCEGFVIDPDTYNVLYDTGFIDCTGTCKMIDYNSPGKFRVHINEYKWAKRADGEQDTCYEVSGNEVEWSLDTVDCNKFSGVSSCS
ncbi:hypothetical protein GLOIN_2v1845426 [Rhizophagus clarus]|uniref:Secreted protein n=1 Tax=Rhizophagus clarus TaxID=94130 RepID=A0A8H3QQC0_9GLOM|nr:hypothetical protein GLOIN_2v1845426 [Rhizophagus clarus]